MASSRSARPVQRQPTVNVVMPSRLDPPAEATMIEYFSTLSGVDLAFYLFLTFMSILAVIATAVSCGPVR